jgi:hypothetical protein
LQAREAAHSPPSSAEVKNSGDTPLSSYISPWRGAKLVTPRDNFTLHVGRMEEIKFIRELFNTVLYYTQQNAGGCSEFSEFYQGTTYEFNNFRSTLL